MNDTTLKISIGEDEAVLYHLRQTNAPRAYDGFGTIHITSFSGQCLNYDERLVLIRDEHLNWQEMRYASGNHTPHVPDYVDMKAVKEELWKRIAGPQE